VTEPDLITKNQIADLLGVSRATVSQWRFYKRSGTAAYAEFPDEVRSEGRSLLWDREAVLSWAAMTDRAVVGS